MATHLLRPFRWILFAVLMLASLVSTQALAQSCPTGSERTFTFVSCPGANDGTATVKVIGGMPNYVFVLQKRVGIASYTNVQASPEVSDTTYTFTGIEPGSYRIEIYDSQVESCYAIYTEGFVIGTTGTTPPNIDISGPTEVCEGQTSVSYSVPLTEGSSYSWSVPADASIVSGASGPENNTIVVNFGALSGQIKVTETNSGGCSGNEASLNINVIPTPEQYTLTVAGATTFCEGSTGPILGLSGSDIGITYTLLRDGNAVATVEGNGSAISFGAHNISGTYTAMAYVTTSSSCTAAMDGSVVLNATTAPALTLTPLHASCAGSTDGSIDLTIGGGTGPFEIEWSTGATTEDISGLAAGNYTVTVTDASGCSVEASAEIIQPEALILTAVITQVSCNGAQDGGIDLSVAGGTAPYTYRWGHGPTSEDLTGLDIGTYSVTVTDANNCTAIQEYEITEPTALSATAVVLQQVSCFGGSDGAIDLSVTGGVAPYTYDWGNGITVEDPANLVAGVYRVLVTDGNNCTTTAEATVTEPAAIEANFTITDATTCGGSEGSIDLSVSGGTAPYTYSWAGGQTTEDLSSLSAGTYIVTITDNNGCELEASATVDQPAGISSLEAILTHVSCFGGNDGAIDLTVNGGTAPYSYRWEHGPATEDLTGLAEGTYTVTVTDAANCELSRSFIITQPAALGASAVLTHVACAGTDSAAIDITVSGGTGSYTYEWSNGATTEDISGLSAGDYTVLIRDGNGCTFSATYTINDGITITLSETIEPVSCNGGSDGAISLEVSGGATPYTFIWSNGANTQNISGLLAGDYTVEVGDANGCTTRATYTITEPLALALTLIAEDATTCGGSEGSINLSVEGGTGTYTYLWSNSETTEDISGLRAGDYEVTVTDAKGCSATAAVTIGQPAGISSLSAIISNISCSGLTDGSINLTVEGGLAPYSFAWDNGATTEDLTGLAEGTYQVVVTDAANCQASETFTISEPALLDVKGTVTHLSCAGDNNGAIDITVSGGTGAYTFEWSNGATTEDLENLAAGDYTILIRDGNGCTFSASYTINEPSALSTTTAVTHISSCTGNDGAVDLTVSGGTAPYTYEWSNGVTDQDLTALAAGTYTVIITDVSGCTATASATVEQPRVMEISATATDVTSCAESNGRIDVTISGGGAPYSYSWSNGATTEDLTGLGVGTYALTVTDANGCTEMVEATVGAPDGISELTAAIVNVDCYDAATGAIDLTVVGGQAPYTYRWSNEANSEDLTALVAGTYSVEVTDANACVATQTFNITQPVAALALSAQLENTTACQAADGAIDLSVSGGTAPYTYVWSNGATTEDLSALIAGTYSVDVTDAAACTISASFTISDASGPEIAAAVTHVLCSGTNTGAIELTVTSGTAPYTYSWSSGASTSNISELASGTYTVTVTDSNGCNAVAEIEVTEPQMLIADAVAEAISCQGEADGSINLTVSGGVAPYQYQWTKDGVAITADTEVLNNLAAGIYEVTVTDTNGCIVGASATVSEPAALQASISGTTSLCAGDTNGSLEASASGGTGSYSYLWNTGATTAAIDGLPAGTYEVSVTDANSCTTMASFTISEEQVVVNLGPDRSACAPASIELLSGYSTDTHDILWSTGETTASIVVSTTDIYSVTVTNRTSGCSGTDDVLVEIENSFEPAVSIAPVNEITCNSEQIILDASITHGGDAPRFQWYRNGDAIGGATEQQYEVGVFNNGDNFSVEVTSSLSCADPQVVYAEYQLILPQVEAPQLSASEAEVCQGGDMPIITETAGGTMRWYYDAANPTNPRIDRSLIIYEGTAFAPSAADYGVGTHNFLVTQTTVHCGESMDWATFALLMTGQECTVPVCEVTPSVSVKILPGSEICPDIRTLTLEADTADIGENPQYAWYYNGTLFSSEAAPSYTSTGGFANGDEFMVEITITDERFICNGNNTISNASTITLVEEIQATAQIQPIDPVCADSNIPVVITADGTYIDWRSEGLGTVYTWYINDVQVQQDTLLGEASTANQLEIVPSELPADAVVRLQVSLPAEISCVLPPADATYAIPFAEPTAPTVSLSSSAPAGACPGTTVTFTASATNAGTNPRYIFTVDGAEVQAGTSNSYVLTDPQNGQQVQVQVVVTDATGLCLSQTEATSDILTVRVLTSEECVGNGFNCGVFGAELTRFVRPSCGERNGALYYQISGGAQPYFVRYTYAGEQVEQVIDASNFELAMERLPAGEVSIYLSDRNGNECSLSTILEAEPRLEITFEKATDGDVQCYGEASGKARLTVAGGNAPYEYMLEGTDTWQTLNGNAKEFDNLPAGIVNILVRNSDTDACPAVASLEILNLYAEIAAVTSITQEANCNDNVGAFTLDKITGGNAALGYQVKLANEDNWRTYTPGMEFTGLARGRHTLVIENGSCQVTTSVVIPSPGLITLAEESRVVTFSCDNPALRNGLFLKIDAGITEVSGPYVADFYMMNNQGTYNLIATEELFNSSGELYKFYLEQGYYRVEVRSQTREGCPEVRDFVIEGSEIPVPITFTASPMNIYCEGAVGGVLISELQGAAGLPYQVEVYQEGVLLTSRAISTFEYATQQQWEVSGLAEGLYQVIIKQDQGLCNMVEQSQPAQVVVQEIDQKLNVSLMGTTVSFPERASGSLSFRVANGSGTSPYEASLVWIDRIEGQEEWSFESYGDQVLKNGTTGLYDYTYNNLPPGIYELTVTDANGCSVILTDTVGYDTNVFVPNFISPNGDGKNDLFHIRNKMPNTQLIITNRWGKVVYQSQNYQNDWGGDALPEGLYYYSIKFPESENGELKGWLQIKRGAQPY